MIYNDIFVVRGISLNCDMRSIQAIKTELTEGAKNKALILELWMLHGNHTSTIIL